MTSPASIPAQTDRVASVIVDAALKVHRALGPGLLGSVYEACLTYELTQRGLNVQRQYKLPIRYENIYLEDGLRIDLLVEDCVIVEIKAVEKMLPVFHAQVLSYLKLSGKRLALLINFNVERIKYGIQRVVL